MLSESVWSDQRRSSVSDRPSGPERRRAPGQFITMDAAMLAAQNERLEQLNNNIVKLAKAVDTRPTREELDRQRKFDRIRRWASVALVGLVLAGFYVQQREISKLIEQDRRSTFGVCEERNRDNGEFLALLQKVQSLAPSPELQAVFNEYAQNLRPVDCTKLLNPQ